MNKSIKKGAIKPLFSKVSSDMQNRILAHYTQIIRENNITKKIEHLTNAIYPTIAAYRALTEAGYSKYEALEMIESSVIESSKPGKIFFETLSKLPFFFKLFGGMCSTGLRTKYKAGFDMRWIERSRHTILWECHRCMYSDEFKRYGLPELTPIFCRADDYLYGNLKGAKWLRNKTIGDGDSLCNFHFKHTRD